MSLQTQIQSLVIRLSDEFKAVHAKIGNLGTLSTTDRSSLTAAINELKSTIASGGSGAGIDDSQVSTTTTWSSDAILTRLDTLKNEILGRADAAYDTLLEIQQALTGNTGAVDTAFTGGALSVLLPATREHAERVTLTGTSGGAVCAAIASSTDDPVQGLSEFWQELCASTPVDVWLNFLTTHFCGLLSYLPPCAKPLRDELQAFALCCVLPPGLGWVASHESGGGNESVQYAGVLPGAGKDAQIQIKLARIPPDQRTWRLDAQAPQVASDRWADIRNRFEAGRFGCALRFFDHGLNCA